MSYNDIYGDTRQERGLRMFLNRPPPYASLPPATFKRWPGRAYRHWFARHRYVEDVATSVRRNDTAHPGYLLVRSQKTRENRGKVYKLDNLTDDLADMTMADWRRATCTCKDTELCKHAYAAMYVYTPWLVTRRSARLRM